MTLPRLPILAAVLGAAIVLSAPAVALAQTDINGVWEVTMTTPQGPNTVDVTFKQQGEAVTGELTSPLGVAPFKGTLVSDALKVVAQIDVQGTALELTFDAKVTPTSLAGTVKFGDFGEAPFEGKRKAGATAAAAAAVAAPAAAPAAAAATTAAPDAAASAAGINGNWNITIDIQGQQMPLTATFAQEGTKLSGSLTSDQGTMPISGTMTGDAMKVEFVAPTPNGDLPIVMTGTLGASGLAGKMNIQGLGDADWVGSRAK